MPQQQTVETAGNRRESKRFSIGKVEIKTDSGKVTKTIAVAPFEGTRSCHACKTPTRHSARNVELELEAGVCHGNKSCHEVVLSHFAALVASPKKRRQN